MSTRTGRRGGRTLDLGFVVLEATAPTHDPLVFINGGPGGASTDAAAGLAFLLAGIREKHDLLFVDLRGTGRSGALSCPLYGDPPSLQKVLGDYFPTDGVEACRASLERKANLTLYTTDSAVDDIDDLRAALGYDTLNLYGGSYGSRVALVYMRRHPKHVRTAILHGVAPPPVPLPLRFPRDAQNALDGVLGECDAEPRCHAAFPALRDELKQIWPFSTRAPSTPPCCIQLPARWPRVPLGYDLTAEALRQMLYEPSSASTIPVVMHEAAARRWTPPCRSGDRRAPKPDRRRCAQGLYLSVTCAEDLPYIEPGVGEKRPSAERSSATTACSSNAARSSSRRTCLSCNRRRCRRSSNSGSAPRMRGEASGEGQANRRDPGRGSTPRRPFPCSIADPIHAARGGGALRADDRRAGEHGHAGAVRSAHDAGGDGGAAQRRDPHLHQELRTGAVEGQEHQEAGRDDRRRTWRTGAAGHGGARETPRRRAQDRQRGDVAGVRRAGLSPSTPTSTGSRSAGDCRTGKRRADRARSEEALSPRGVGPAASADHLLRTGVLSGARS